MGLINWCQDRWLMMMRTKPHYISILGRKRSSIKSPPKLSSREEKCGKKFGVFLCIATMCCSISYGVLLISSKGVDPTTISTCLVSLTIAGIASITSGLCLAEYISTQSQEMPSVYSCCYQYSSEILAFFIGWTWLISQTAVISAICKILSSHVNEWTNGAPREFLKSVFHEYAQDIPSLLFLLFFILFILTGFGESVIWYAVFIPITFVMITTVTVITYIMSNYEISLVDSLHWSNIKGVTEILRRSTVCILFFSGPQSILRIPATHLRKHIPAVLGPLNVINLLLAFAFIVTATISGELIKYASPNELLSLTTNILCTISLCSLGIEAFYPLHFVTEDMSSDGLLFRNFSKRWKPFCLSVPSPIVHVLAFVVAGLISVFMPLEDVLNLAVVFPLLVSTVVPCLVLIQRYRDNNSWQYEPMFHTSARHFSSDRSRKKSLEFQYSNCPGFDVTEECDITACVDENLSDSNSSDTDIDAVVQQYKEQTQIANMTTLEDPTRSAQAPEPTPSSSFKAKFCIFVLMVISLVVSLTLNFADSNDHLTVIIIVLLFVTFSVIVHGLLLCLPQNENSDGTKNCCSKFPTMPWIPGIASLISSSLLVQSLMQTWRVYLGYFMLGVLIYFCYGIRSSTAANSFYNIRTTHIALRPLPSYGNKCIPQIVPAQRKSAKWRKHSKLKTFVK